MQPSRARLGIMASLLGLVAVLGVVWLVRSATTDTADTSASDTTSGSADVRSNGAGDGDGTRSRAASDGTEDGSSPSSGEGKKHKGGRPAFSVNGVNVNGSGDNGCVVVMNQTETDATITGVSFKAVGDAGEQGPALRSDNGAHCLSKEGGYEGIACEGRQVKAQAGCVAGAAKVSKPQHHYVVHGTVTATFLCDNARKDPCDKVKDWRGRTPTAQHPVLISGTSTSLSTEIGVGKSSSAPPDDSPSSKSPSPPGGVSPPPVSPSPRSPDGGSSAPEEQ